ncbi:hypothetical protein [Roseateles sp. DAIF2]|uniref:DUF6980 family protein n=1 Tax=Roseateles sp. DAIF2 TaxID=2714952 RepID=UPI00353038B8
MTAHCCDSMSYWANRTCDQHATPFECPDALVLFDATSGQYGLIVHDGGSSTITIQHCPWCGHRLHTPHRTDEPEPPASADGFVPR